MIMMYKIYKNLKKLLIIVASGQMLDQNVPHIEWYATLILSILMERIIEKKKIKRKCEIGDLQWINVSSSSFPFIA